MAKWKPDAPTAAAPEPTQQAVSIVTCSADQVEAVINARLVDFDLVSASAYQKGTGFGAIIEALLVFRRKDA